MKQKHNHFFKFTFTFSLAALTLFLGLFLSPHLRAMEITLEVDRNELTLEDPLDLQIIIEGEGSLPDDPKLLNTDGFQIQGSGQSSQVSIVNGVARAKKIYHYILIPQRIGQFKIGPAEVEFQGQMVKSNEAVVQVKEAGSGGSAALGDPGEEEGKPRPENGQKPYFIEAEISEKNPYVNQQLVYTFRFFTRAQVTNASLNLPDFKGFWKEELQGQREYETVFNGQPWKVNEIKLALFPTDPGPLTILPAQLNAQALVEGRRHTNSLFDSFFYTNRQLHPLRLKTKSLDLSVRPLPKENRPSTFSGGVGNFLIRGALSKNELKVGESVTLTLQVEGEGNIQDIKIPDVDWDGMKFYDDKPEVKIIKGPRGIMGSKTIKKALVPLRQVDGEMPPINLVYFDPQTHEYKTVSTTPFPLRVLPVPREEAERLALMNATSSSDSVVKKDIQVVGEDLMPLKNNEETVLVSQESGPWTKGLLFSFLFFLPLLNVGGNVYRQKWEKIKNDQGYKTRKGAFRNFQDQMKKIDWDRSFFSDLSQCFRIYLGDRLNLDGKALTPADAPRKLLPLKVPDDLVKEIQNHLQTLELGQYGGTTMDLAAKRKIHHDLQNLVKRFEKEVEA